MDAVTIVVLEVILENAAQMPFAKDDDVVQALAANTAVESFRIWILPRTSVRGQNVAVLRVMRKLLSPVWSKNSA